MRALLRQLKPAFLTTIVFTLICGVAYPLLGTAIAQTAFKDKAEISKFMHEKVVPEMAAAMGQKPYDPATKTGFGCMNCHAVEMK